MTSKKSIDQTFPKAFTLTAGVASTPAGHGPAQAGISIRRSQLCDPHRQARRLVELYLSDKVLDIIDQYCPLYALPFDPDPRHELHPPDRTQRHPRHHPAPKHRRMAV